MTKEQETMIALIARGYTGKDISKIMGMSYNKAWKKCHKAVDVWRGWNKRIPKEGDILEHISGETWRVLSVRPEYFNMKSNDRELHRHVAINTWIEGKVKYRHINSSEVETSVHLGREPQLYDTLKRGGEQYIICEILEDGYRVKKNERGSHSIKIPKEFERKGYRLLNYAPVEVRREDVSQ